MSSICRSVLACGHLHTPKGRRSFDLSLYLVANRPSFQDENLFFSKINASVKGGVSCVQLRDHQSDFDATLRTAARLKEMIKGIPLFINTLKPIEVALAIDAQGIYLEEKFPYSEARKLLGRTAIIGIPVKTINEALALGKTNEVDYISVKIAPSKRTCPRNDEILGRDGLRSIRAISPHRIVAIGGLNLECVESVYRELRIDDGIAMAGGLMEEEYPCLTAQKIQEICQRVRGEL